MTATASRTIIKLWTFTYDAKGTAILAVFDEDGDGDGVFDQHLTITYSY